MRRPLIFSLLVASAAPLAGQSEFAILGRTRGPRPHPFGEFAHSRLVDLDGDRDLEFVSPVATSAPLTQFRYHAYIGSLEFAAPWARPVPGGGVLYFSLAIGDCNSDGYPDLLIPQSSTTTPVSPILLLGSPYRFVDASASHLPQGAPELGRLGSATFCDVDGDRDLDAVLGPSIGTITGQVLLNDGTGRFTLAPSLALNMPSSLVLEIQAADLDGDGDQDLVFGMHGAAAQTWHNDGTGRFTRRQTFFTVPAHSLVRIGDVDGDRDLDFVMFAAVGRTFPTYPPRVFVNDGLGNFSDETAQRLPPHDFEEVGALADFDGDGDLDIVAPTQNLNATGNGDFDVWSQWVNDGTGVFTAASQDLMPRTTEPRFLSGPLTAGDIDADGDVDIAMGFNRNWPPGRVEILWNMTRHVYPPSEPRLGMPYEVRVWARPGHTVALLLAFAGARFDLGAFGVLEIDPSVVLAVPPVVMPAAGPVSFTFPISHDPALLGLDLWWQAVDADPIGEVRLTAAFHDVVK